MTNQGQNNNSINERTYQEVEYLKKNLGPILVAALAEICIRRPADPIEYLGHWLLRWRYNEELKRRDVQNALEVVRQCQWAHIQQENNDAAPHQPPEPTNDGFVPSHPHGPPGFGGPLAEEGTAEEEENEYEEGDHAPPEEVISERWSSNVLPVENSQALVNDNGYITEPAQNHNQGGYQQPQSGERRISQGHAPQEPQVVPQGERRTSQGQAPSSERRLSQGQAPSSERRLSQGQAPPTNERRISQGQGPPQEQAPQGQAPPGERRVSQGQAPPGERRTSQGQAPQGERRISQGQAENAGQGPQP